MLGEPMITDKLKSYSAAHREVLPSAPESTEQYDNNRAEVEHRNRLVNANDRCVGSYQLARLSAFLRFMAWFQFPDL